MTRLMHKQAEREGRLWQQNAESKNDELGAPEGQPEEYDEHVKRTNPFENPRMLWKVLHQLLLWLS